VRDTPYLVEGDEASLPMEPDDLASFLTSSPIREDDEDDGHHALWE